MNYLRLLLLPALLASQLHNREVALVTLKRAGASDSLIIAIIEATKTPYAAHAEIVRKDH